MTQSANEKPSRPSVEDNQLQWFWIFAGAIVGFFLTGASIYLIHSQFHVPQIPVLIGCLGFILTGIIVGYYSPGHTVKEAAAAGFLLAILAIVIMKWGFEIQVSLGMIIGMLISGFFLAQLGGWVGEELEGDDETGTVSFNWHWIVVGAVIGMVLNNFLVFFIFPASGNLWITIASFAVSFFITGYIVGYKSPGVTIYEAGIAGFLIALLDGLFINFGLDIGFKDFAIFGVKSWYFLVLLFLCVILALFGGWVGEKVQARVEASNKS